ncbi:MAG: hypothetical protein OCU17_07700, partial [Methanophagales archaeon]|nr:hypothetical protein [Methanophagales archaeon]
DLIPNVKQITLSSPYHISSGGTRFATIMSLIMSINRSTSGIFSLLAVFFALIEPIASSMIVAIIHF